MYPLTYTLHEHLHVFRGWGAFSTNLAFSFPYLILTAVFFYS